MESSELHRVLDGRIARQDPDRKVLADVLDPTALADRTKPERDCFVKAFGTDLGGVLDSFGIADRDAAGRSDCRKPL